MCAGSSRQTDSSDQELANLFAVRHLFADNLMVMRFLFATLLFAAIPASGFAQTFVDVSAAAAEFGPGSQRSLTEQLLHTPGGMNRNEGVLPLWSTPDGRVLALVALGNNSATPILPQAPQIGSAVDWQLVDVTSFITAGMSLRISDNASAYASFGHGILLTPLYATTPSPGCGQPGAFGIGNPCANDSTLGHTGTLQVGTDLTAGNVDIDLNYGLSWLRLNDQSTGQGQRPTWDLFTNLGNETLPTLVIPGIELANVQSSGFNAEGRWNLDDNRSIDLGAALNRIQFEMPGTPLLPSLNQAALSLGLHRGDFSGVVVGRVVGPGDRLNGNNQRWSALDLGISWRSPWRGVFSVGAQNIWSSGNLPALTDPTSHEVDANQARVPYVQYHQDL
jgi:hypothetical protein